MQKIWINQSQNPDLIVFFNGWAMDEKPFCHLHDPNYDCILFFHYFDLQPDALTQTVNFSAYQNIFVIAWSYGVFVSSLFYRLFPGDKTQFIAVNGTLNPIDQEYGILPSLFQGTLNRFSDRVRQKFYANLFMNQKHYRQFLKTQPRRSLACQRGELLFLKYNIEQEKQTARPDLKYKAIVCQKDRIFFRKNQARFWQKQDCPIILKDEAHFPFYSWESWEEIINE